MEVSGQRTFSLGSCLGKGGFGEVYRATMASSGGLSRDVAVKLLRADLDMHDEAVKRLRDEGRLLSQLDHPALLKVYDLVELGGRVALVTEFIDGDDLAECFQARPPMPVRAVLQAIGRVAEALHVAWTAPLGPQGRALRLVHRDIKPSNLRLGKHGEVKVLDFGIARSDEVARESRTSTDLIIGSPAYMAPERFLDNEVRSASDVFALGCCLYEGLTGGERLLGGQTAMVLSTMALDKTRYDEFIAARPLPDTVPEDVRALVSRCLEHQPELRPTAQELARRCEELADELGGLTLRRWTRSRDWPTGAVNIPSPLAGQVITEGSLAISREREAEDDAVEQGQRRSAPWIFLSTLLVAALVIGVLVAGVGGAVYWNGRAPDADEPVSAALSAEPAVAEPVATEPSGQDTAAPARTGPTAVSSPAPVRSEPAVDPAPRSPDPEPHSPDPAPRSPDPEPRSPDPQPVAAPVAVPQPAVVEPAVAEPEPVVEPAPVRQVQVTRVRPEPAPVVVNTTPVALTGSIEDVWLERDGARVSLSLAAAVRVAEGEWTLVSNDSANGTRRHGSVQVVSGRPLAVNCSASFASCRAR